MSNTRRTTSKPMSAEMKAALEKSLAEVGPMPVDANAEPSFEEGGVEYQARADRCQMEFQNAWRKKVETMYWANNETGGMGLTQAYLDNKRIEYLLNFVFPRGTVERLIFETGWETLLEHEYGMLPETAKQAQAKQREELNRRILLAKPGDLPPGFSHS